MNEIILHGGLRDRYGETFRMDCRDPVDAYRGLAAQLPGFRDAIRIGEFQLVRQMPNGAFAIDDSMFFLGMDNCRLHIIPSVGGAASQGNKGGVKLVLGIAIIGASLFIPGGQMFAGLALQTMGIMTGAALALGGLALILAPQPKLNNDTNGDKKDSYLFNGDVNPSGQNIAVPIGFGKFRVPGIPVSTQIVTNQISSGDTPISTGEKILDIVGGDYLNGNPV